MGKRAEKSRLRDTPFGEALVTVRPYVLPALSLTFGLLIVILAFQRAERFLNEDPRFLLHRPDLGSKLSPDLRLGGVQRAQPQAIRAVFRKDEGESVFRIPLEERRKKIEEIKWVRRASVSRVWPNLIDVRLEERVPVAFVQLTSRRKGEQQGRVSLIDEEGELLPVIPGANYALPMVTGIREEQQPAARAARVRLMRKFLNDLGDLGKSVSEIDVCKEDNIRVVYPMDGRAITLSMGGDQFQSRLKRFLHYYPEIQKKMPEVVGLDLRLEDRITADQLERQECDGQR
jgi:cell division protein FtsQ